MIRFNPWTVRQIGHGVFSRIKPKIKYSPSKMVSSPMKNGIIIGIIWSGTPIKRNA